MNNEFFHGVRTQREPYTDSKPIIAASGVSFVVGTAPIHTIVGINDSCNEPIYGRNFAEAQRYLGYSDDWGMYDICEVMYSHYTLYKTAPVIFINVLDPAKHKKSTAVKAYKVVDGQIELPFEAISTSLKVEDYKLNEDYCLFYDNKTLILEIIEDGTIPVNKTELQISFDEVDPSKVTKIDIIGGFDVVAQKRRGLELIEAVFPKFGILPDICLCPNWSHDPDVAAVMAAKIDNYNGIFKGKALCDVDAADVKFYEDAVKWKKEKGISGKNQVLCFPLVKKGGRVYRMSTHMAGLIANVDAANDGCPCESPSNKTLQIDSMVLKDGTEVLLDLQQANYLNANGVTTALNFTGEFVLWGNYTAVYPSCKDPNEYFLYASRLFDWISNTVILTTWKKVDGKVTRRYVDSIIDMFNIWFNGITREEKILGGRIEYPAELNTEETFRSGKNTFKIHLAAPGIGQELVFILAYDSSYVEQMIGG